MSSRHQAMFAGATVAFIALCLVLASARMYVMHWWMAKCGEASQSCRAAELAIDYWWVALLAGASALAIVAHWLTRGRLALANAPQPDRGE
jgi:hypothetical protein